MWINLSQVKARAIYSCDGISLLNLVGVLQDPETMLLQQRAYSQLTGNEDIPEKYRRSVDSQLDEMKKAAEGKVVLMICDDVCKCSRMFVPRQVCYELLQGISSLQTPSPVSIQKIAQRCC